MSHKYKAHLDRRGAKPFSPKKIAHGLELVCGQGKSIKEASQELDVAFNSLSQWLTKHWFYKKIEDPAIIVFKSKV
jgi:transposase-like protein